MKGIEEQPQDLLLDHEESAGEGEDEKMNDVADKDTNEEEENSDKKNLKKKKKAEKIKKDIDRENKEMGKVMMTKKARRMFSNAEFGMKKKREIVKKLENKRKAIETHRKK